MNDEEDDDIRGYEKPAIPESILALIEEEAQRLLERSGINEELFGEDDDTPTEITQEDVNRIMNKMYPPEKDD